MKAFQFLWHLLLVTTISAQSVENVDYNYNSQTEKINITFDLIEMPQEKYFNISLEVQIDAQTVKTDAISGDIGKYVKAGAEKKIDWDVFKDVKSLEGNLTIKVVAIPSGGRLSTLEVEPRMPVQQVPAWAGMGSVTTIGLGILGLGASNFFGSSSDQDPKRPRVDNYDDLNKKYKTGQYLMAAGGAVFVGAGYMLIKRLRDRKRATLGSTQNGRRFRVSPSLDPQKGAGLSLSYQLQKNKRTPS